ncbi:hypothetical protein PsYK624_138850 [Phanerochaete sordida]|uniref:AIG1-type G domain-containing protein n=1 Tax=Phanerochaete sordida TaxID=48140 RepID=A0A9P3GNW3_9APHY|nr:hypothetical protein PsYK624_138850 [Phanerochaete sordida]
MSSSTQACANDPASLRQGIVRSPSHRFDYTVLLVGETGVGKTSFLSLLANILAGHKPDEYVDLNDPENEQVGSPQHSQTKAAKVYELTTKNGILLRILDTPGLSDMRGIEQDELHKKDIAQKIISSIHTVDAILILANGTNPRLGFATSYALTTLASIFPRTLAKNIGIVFTNVMSPLSWNIDEVRVPEELRAARQFLLDNPAALQKNLVRLSRKEGISPAQVAKMHEVVAEREQVALDMLAELFDWLGTLAPKPTKDIIALYEQTQAIEQSTTNALARMQASSEHQRKLQQVLEEMKREDQDIAYYKQHVQDHVAAERLARATEAKEAREHLADVLRERIDESAREVQAYTEQVAQLAAAYSALALSGSLAAQIEKTVVLLDYNIVMMRQTGQPSEFVTRVMQSRENMQMKLEMLKKTQ